MNEIITYFFTTLGYADVTQPIIPLALSLVYIKILFIRSFFEVLALTNT